MQVKTKKESIEKIKELDLNTFEADVIDSKNLDKIEEFFKKNPAQEYVLRDTEKAAGKFFFVKDFDECKKILKNYKKNVTIVVSFNDLKDDLVLLGDICVKKELENDSVDITARTDKEATHRNVYEKPEYNYHTTLEDNRLWDIPGFSKLIAYITEHELYDIIVEFAVFDCPVGNKKEKVAICELRSEF